MQPKQFSRLSGLMLCLSGAAYIVDTGLDAFAPAQSPGLGFLVPVFGLAGFPGLWLALGVRTSLAYAAFVLNMLALGGLVTVTFLNNRLFPDLAPEQIAAIVAQIKPELVLFGVVFLVAAVLLGWVCAKLAPVYRIGAALYGLGAIPVSLPPLMPEWLVTIGGLSVGAGLLIFASALLGSKADDGF